MDWSTVVPLLTSAAPTVGKLLGGFIPFPGGAILGEMAGKVLSEALGCQTDPASVADAITKGDPAAVEAALSKAEAEINAQVEMHKADLADLADARSTNIGLVQAGSPLAWGPVAISTLVVVGFIGCIFVLMFYKVNFTETSGQAFLILTGILSQAFGSVVNFYLGSSAGSADKSNQIAALATAQIARSAPPPTPVRKR